MLRHKTYYGVCHCAGSRGDTTTIERNVEDEAVLSGENGKQTFFLDLKKKSNGLRFFKEV
jgi:hypothetical protein